MTRNLMRTTLAAGLAWAALLAAGPAAGSGPTGAGEPFGMLSVDEVSGRLGQPGFHVLDANDAKKYASAHVPGAIRVAYREFSEKDLPADRGATLVFYCANTRWMASHDAARRAAKLGWKNVFVMPDGIDGWVKAGKPVARGDAPGSP